MKYLKYFRQSYKEIIICEFRIFNFTVRFTKEQKHMRQDKPPIPIIGEILYETAKAIQFEWTDHDTEDDPVTRTEWFPFSQVNEIHRTTPAKLVVSDWIYNEKVKSWE